MPIGQLPTKTDGTNPGELGRVVDDRPRTLPPDLRFDVPAAVYERIKDQIIENSTCLGTATTPAAGSVSARLDALESGGGSFQHGGLLFGWNRTDTTQFESTAQPFDNNLGGGTRNADTAMVLTVADLGDRHGNGLIFTCTSLQGGGFFPVLTAELTLPEQYVVYCEWFSGDTAFPFGVVPYADISTPSDVQGYILEATSGLSGMNWRAIVDDQLGNAETWTTSQSLLAGTADRGGLKVLFEVKRQRTADNPGYSFATGEIRIPGSTGNVNDVKYESALPHNISGVSPNHHGLNMNRIGLGGSEGVNGSTGVFRIRRFEIYAHPDD